LTLPLPDGSFGRFKIVESPMLEPALAAKYPEIKTYSGRGVDDPTITTRFDLTYNGFQAIILSSQGTILIAPYARAATQAFTSAITRRIIRPKLPPTASSPTRTPRRPNQKSWRSSLLSEKA